MTLRFTDLGSSSSHVGSDIQTHGVSTLYAYGICMVTGVADSNQKVREGLSLELLCRDDIQVQWSFRRRQVTFCARKDFAKLS